MGLNKSASDLFSYVSIDAQLHTYTSIDGRSVQFFGWRGGEVLRLKMVEPLLYTGTSQIGGLMLRSLNSR